ncbi:MAG TPA: hypothetical protein VFU21_12115 [Kofleriaceae bacterium]|nr:hypothetical protein [Kofleriaceae bacterium]
MKFLNVAPLLLLSACVLDPDTGSLEQAAGAGPIDQQQTSHPFVSGAYTCFADREPGLLAQEVTPGMSSWEVISLHLAVPDDVTGDQVAPLAIRDGAIDGPALASATATVPDVPGPTDPGDSAGNWVDFVFSPPVDLTPGSPVFLVLEVHDRVAWAADRFNGDVYPGGLPYGWCDGSFDPWLLDGDFTFITYAPPGTEPDGDGDGLPDAEDPSTAADAADALPDSSFHAPGHRNAIDNKLADAEAAILAGDTAEARAILEQLRRHLDGCETGATADRNDWITDCADQDAIRALVDGILAGL